jgi:TonB family protein
MRLSLLVVTLACFGCHAHDSASKPVEDTPKVHGSLDKEVIRGTIRTHLGEVSDCYDAELAKGPFFEGRVMVQFTIAGAGNVVESVVQESTAKNAAVEKCITDAVRAWMFPQPKGGGIVVVSYPFVLRAAPGAEDSPDKNAIRNTIRPHLGEVKACYDAELAKGPWFEGKVTVQFTIARAGNVIASGVEESTAKNPPVEKCIADAVRTWTFSKPSSGNTVVVSYPFVLRTSP